MSTVSPTAHRTRRSLRVRAAATVAQSGRETGRRPALAVLVAALVVGILGMHALASHATPATSDASPDMASMVGMAAAAAFQADDSSPAHASHADDIGVQIGQISATGSGSGDGVSMLMLCAVMLTAAALTLLVLLPVGIFRPLLPVAFAPAAVPARTLQRVRGTGPPHEWHFSVIRC